MKNKLLILITALLATTTTIYGLNVMRLTKINQELKKQKSDVVVAYERAESVDIYGFASEIYNVPIYLLKAIERHETGNYTSVLYSNKNNTHGCKQANGNWCNFDSIEQSTLELARTLAFKYKVKREYFNLEHIANDYCKKNCETWVSSIEQLIKEETNAKK